MENASKALIIAGAILLAILIIGLGIFIYRQAANTVSDTGMDQLAIQQFNAQFENFLDKEITGTAAKSLYDTILNNDNTAETEATKVKLKINGTTVIDGTTVTSKSAITATSKYFAHEKTSEGEEPAAGEYSRENGRIKIINLGTKKKV